MTTPNEELILKLRGQAYTTCRPDQLCDQAADLLQSQAERIKELEKQHIERLLRIEAEVDVLVAERDELREKYADTYWALDDAARENTSLRAAACGHCCDCACCEVKALQRRLLH